tara:strand:+ start:370 stop:573 length:204 start_codon:yes stop_codon:yes gene_type:complete
MMDGREARWSETWDLLWALAEAVQGWLRLFVHHVIRDRKLAPDEVNAAYQWEADLDANQHIVHHKLF